MAELFVGPIIEKLINIGFEYLKDQFRWQTGMKKELQRLQDIHPQIQAVVVFASSQTQIRDQYPDLNRWLWQLRDVIDEADDVLDEFEYMKLEKQLTKNKKQRKVRCIMKFINKRLVKIVKRALKIDPNLKRLEEVVQKLDKISAGVDTFRHLVKDARKEQQEQQEELNRTRETGALPKNDLIGRAQEKEFVMEWLRKSSNEEHQATLYRNISLLSIVGHGGMGKTTLLQHVYEDEMTEEFDLKMWACVSNNFDAKKVIADMLESLKMNRPHLESLNALQKSLKSAVNSKKFLLVLDDIWQEEEEERNKSKWENVLAPLAVGSLGSKILVTTRMDSVASMIANVMNKTKVILKLEGLKEDECLQLLNKYAFANEENHPNVVHHKLGSIAEKIVKKLSGSPLAARVVGCVLKSSLDERYWTRVLNYDIGSQNDILRILKLSYIFLPKPLQNCFAFCGMFPQDHMFDKDDLIKMWISLSFIQPPYIQGETVKDIAERYFDVLIKKSLFDEFQITYSTYYKMHDLLHEMICSISAQECSSIVGDDEELVIKIPLTIRHLFVETHNLEVLRKMKNFKNLHSLWLSYDNEYEDFVNVLTDIFKILRSIRLLSIHALCQKQIPEEIGQLIHLRYLKIVNTNVTLLPRSLSNLYHLQFMTFSQNIFDHCMLLETLPPFGQLPSLKSLCLGHMPYIKQLDYNFRGNDKDCVFPSLQVLEIKYLEALEDWFDARAVADGRLFPCLTELYLEDCQNLQELPSLPPKLEKLEIKNIGWKTLNWLHGTSNRCSISILQCSNLICLRGLITENCQLILSELDINDPSMLLMEPSITSLEKLKIKNNDAVVSFPNEAEQWFLKVSSSLRELEFGFLTSLQSLPSSLESLSSLKYIYVRNVPQLQQLPNMPASLEQLKLEELKSLQSLPSSLESISSLKYLYVRDVPRLRQLPNMPASLEQLKLEELESLQSLPSSLESLSSLETLKVEKVPCLQQLPNLPASLENLELEELESLQSLPSSLESLSSLKYIYVRDVPRLQQLPNMSASLKQLKLEELKSLQSLPSFLESLSSLKYIYVGDVPRLRQLPNMPASLEHLKLVELESLQSLPSSLESLSSLKTLKVKKVPGLQQLPNLPASLEILELKELESLQSLPSSLESLSSLKCIYMRDVPRLQQLPNMPTSVEQLMLEELKSLESLPSSLKSLSSLKYLYVRDVPRLQQLPNLPASLEILELEELESLQSLPSSLESLSSLETLKVEKVPRLQQLSNLPASLENLDLKKLESLQSLPSSLESLSSLRYIDVGDVPRLQLLPNMPASLNQLYLSRLEFLQSLPSSLESLSSLQVLWMIKVPRLQQLPNLPASLKNLYLEELESLQSLPSSLESLSSLETLRMKKVPRLQQLPNLPASLKNLYLEELESLQSLPSSLESLSSLETLEVKKVPRLQQLPNLPASLEKLDLDSLESLDCLPSCLPSLFCLKELLIIEIPQLQELPNLPPSISLTIENCNL